MHGTLRVSLGLGFDPVVPYDPHVPLEAQEGVEVKTPRVWSTGDEEAVLTRGFDRSYQFSPEGLVGRLVTVRPPCDRLPAVGPWVGGGARLPLYWAGPGQEQPLPTGIPVAALRDGVTREGVSGRHVSGRYRAPSTGPPGACRDRGRRVVFTGLRTRPQRQADRERPRRPPLDNLRH